MNQYVVYSKILSNRFEEVISQGKFEELNKSKEILNEIFAKEKIYNIILMNYYEFEEELFVIILKDEIFQSDYSHFSEYLSKIEQRILNLLSSITLYLDSFKDNLKEAQKYSIHLKPEFKNVADYLEKIRTNDKEIEIMRLLRNHIQHNGLLITNFSLNGVNLSDELREQTLKFEIDKSTIKARGFNIDDFADLDEMVDLKKIIRVYMDFISDVHHTFRELTNEKVQNARAEYEKIFQNYPNYKYLYIAKKINNKKMDEIPILLNWDDIRLEMIKKNIVPKAFKRHSISTK